jgi:hypothetical protein
LTRAASVGRIVTGAGACDNRAAAREGQGVAIDALPRIGGMATMPSRAASFKRALPHILPQVERLYLFLDGYRDLPACARDPRIVPLFSTDFVALHASGKFLGAALHGGDHVYATFDDDILYRPGHVARLAAALARHGGRAVVGVHGTVFRPPYASYARDRRNIHFNSRLWFERTVDQVGTGTSALIPALLPVDPRDWGVANMCDLMVALAAARAGVPCIAIRRRTRILDAIERLQPGSIWEATLRDDSRHRPFLEALMRLRGRWPAATVS